MSIFRKKGKGNPDLSLHLRGNDSWCLRRYERFSAARVIALTSDPVLDVYACGFDNGEIHLYGSSPVHFVFTIPGDIRQTITQVQVLPTPKRLVCIVNGSMLVWSLDGILVDKPVSTIIIPDSTAFIGTSTQHSHAFIPHPDGTIHTYDLLHLRDSPTTIIPSPDASEGVIMDLIHNPRNIDLLVVATYGSVYLWKFSLHLSLTTFVLPGNEPLRPVCLSFHPNEDIMLAGLLDGRLVFWNIFEPIPLWITTVSELLGQAGSDTKTPEPVFKLLWAASAGLSSLTILGGKPAGQSRLVTLHFDAIPFSDREQLTPQSITTYDDLTSADVKDFIQLFRSNNLLALREKGLVTLLPNHQSSVTGQNPGEKSRPSSLQGSTSFLPYELHPPSILGHISICSSARTRFFASLLQEHSTEALVEGGLCRPHIREHGPDPRLSKYEECRLMTVIHEDGVIRFHDISSKHLLTPDPLTSPYPAPFPKLSIDVKTLLDEPLLWASLGDTSVSALIQLEFIAETLEVYAVLEKGEIIVWKYHQGESSQTASVDLDPKFIELSSLAVPVSSFSPRFIFSCNEGKVTALATSEVGFIAAAYESGAVYVLDMRGPRIMQRRNDKLEDPIRSMRFTICSLDAKSSKQLLLVMLHQSGLIVILRINKTGPHWSVDQEAIQLPAKKSLPHPTTCFLVDLLSGEDMEATAHSFASLHSATAETTKPAKSSFAGETYRIIVSAGAIRCDTGFNGSMIKLIEFGHILTSGIVRRNDSSALVAFDEDGPIYILSIPQLQILAKFQAPFSSKVMKSVQLIKGTSDFLVKTDSGFEVWTLSPNPRAEQPEVTLPIRHNEKNEGPGLISWLLGRGQGMSGEEFDSMIGGPDRPIRSPMSPPAASTNRKDNSNVFSEVLAATSERGELIGSIAEQTDELGHAAEGMAAQAQRLAARQSKRHRFGF